MSSIMSCIQIHRVSTEPKVSTIATRIGVAIPRATTPQQARQPRPLQSRPPCAHQPGAGGESPLTMSEERSSSRPLFDKVDIVVPIDMPMLGHPDS
eukprot:c4699_g1_i1 orf=126-413(+)